MIMRLIGKKKLCPNCKHALTFYGFAYADKWDFLGPFISFTFATPISARYDCTHCGNIYDETR